MLNILPYILPYILSYILPYILSYILSYNCLWTGYSLGIIGLDFVAVADVVVSVVTDVLLSSQVQCTVCFLFKEEPFENKETNCLITNYFIFKN